MQEWTQFILHLCFMFAFYSLWKEHSEAVGIAGLAGGTNLNLQHV